MSFQEWSWSLPLLSAPWLASACLHRNRYADLPVFDEHVTTNVPIPRSRISEESVFFKPFVNFGVWYSDTAKRAPFTTGLITTGLKTTAADLFAQKVQEIESQRGAISWAGYHCFAPSDVSCELPFRRFWSAKRK